NMVPRFSRLSVPGVQYQHRVFANRHASADGLGQAADDGAIHHFAHRPRRAGCPGGQYPVRRQLTVCLRPVTAYGLPFKAFEMSRIDRCARMLLPASSSGGEMTAMPKLPGETAMIPPPTPLFAGSPVWYSHLPASS